MTRHHPTAALPEPHASFLANAVTRLQDDERILAVAIGGSFLTQTIDEFSDLDLVIVVEPSAVQALMLDRQSIAEKLGTLLVAFTGEHVGEPRLLICLYGPPLLHVDLKFLSLTDAAHRVEDPAILWEREDRLSAVLRRSAAAFPAPDLQWLEDRFGFGCTMEPERSAEANCLKRTIFSLSCVLKC